MSISETLHHAADGTLEALTDQQLNLGWTHLDNKIDHLQTGIKEGIIHDNIGFDIRMYQEAKAKIETVLQWRSQTII